MSVTYKTNHMYVSVMIKNREVDIPIPLALDCATIKR